MGSFIVEFWSRVFDLPKFVSPHWWIGQVSPSVQTSYRFVDAWVLGHFFASALLFVATATPPLQWLESIAVVYGGLMVTEALFYEINVLVFSAYRAAKNGRLQVVLSHRRLVITSLQNYATIIFWFALFYRHWQHLYTVKPSHGTDQLLTWLALSFKTMTGLGHVSVEPQTMWAHGLLFTQAAIGVSMALLIVVSFVRLLPKPGTRDFWESFMSTADERGLAELAKMGRNGNMPNNEEPQHALANILHLLATGILALGLSRTVKPEEVPDKARPYALTAIVGSLLIGALCLGFAYQLFSGGSVATLHRHGPIVAWAAGNICPGCLFLAIGFALLVAGLGMATIAAIWASLALRQQHKTEDKQHRASRRQPKKKE
jgi:hypothetical protein